MRDISERKRAEAVNWDASDSRLSPLGSPLQSSQNSTSQACVISVTSLLSIAIDNQPTLGLRNLSVNFHPDFSLIFKMAGR
jgi:hypothetical protein